MEEKARFYVMATITHPRWKLRWVKPENYDEIFEIFVAEMSKENSKLEKTNSENNVVTRNEHFIYLKVS